MTINSIAELIDYELTRYKSVSLSADFYKSTEEREEAVKNYMDNKMKIIFTKYPYLKVLKAIEDEGYGTFAIGSMDNYLPTSKQAMASFLFRPDIFQMGNDAILFYNKDSRDACSNIVFGTDINDLAKKYISMCLNGRLVIRFRNSEGIGYATDNIRNIIFNSGIQINV